MKLWKLSAILLLTMSSGLSSGCLERQVYLEKGQRADIARPVKVRVWIKNKETGKRELRVYHAQAGDAVGRMK